MIPTLLTAAAPAVGRTSPEWSDVALFVAAVLAVWFLRRALRARFRRGDRE